MRYTKPKLEEGSCMLTDILTHLHTKANKLFIQTSLLHNVTQLAFEMNEEKA